MQTAPIRPDSDTAAVEWLVDPPPLVMGGRIEHRRQSPLPGWWFCGRRAIGPFSTPEEARRAVRAARYV